MAKASITQETLKNYVDYDPETGVFTRKITTAGNAIAGSVMGCKNKQGYLVFHIQNKLYYAHRMAWLYFYGYNPDKIDHIDHDRSNNKIKNLRQVTHQGNMKNMKMKKNNKSGIAGVHWDKKGQYWHAYIDHNGRINLAYERSLFEACCARKSAENKYGFHENHGAY